MVKIKVTDRGIVTEPGSGFEVPSVQVTRDSTNLGFMPHQMATAQTFTSNVTLTGRDAGLCILSASQGVITATMPDVTTVPGALYVVRSSSPSAHAVTGSNSGVLFVERGESAAPITGSQGQKITFPGTTNSSVVLLSDGFRWLVLTGSGSLTYTAP